MTTTRSIVDTARLYALIAQLASPVEEERFNAIKGLSVRVDKRAIPHLIAVLRNPSEVPSLRGDAAEALRLRTKKKMITQALAECSADPSPAVRFWCVFSMGHFVRRRKTPTIVRRALEARLDDLEYPRGWWPIGLEALAMLQHCRTSRLPLSQMFLKTILEAMKDPLRNPVRWLWADEYWCDSVARKEPGGWALWDASIEKITAAGFDLVTFGRTNTRL
jgi:hypothetical protein